jgi:D-arginine dehydrogenase
VFDFIVIGAGIAGVSIADSLAATASVALIEAEPHPGYHASARSAALFAPNYGSETFRALTRASAAFLHSPPPDFCPDPLLGARGTLYVARVDQRERLRAAIDEIRASGGEIENLAPEAARAMVPLLRSGYAAAAAYEANVLDIDVAALLQAFLRRGRSRGVRLLLGERVAAPVSRAGGWELSVQGEQIRGEVLVNAAGAWADQVAAACGVTPIGLRAMRRTAALIDAPAGVSVRSWPAIFDVDEQFYLKPDAGRLLISPADEEEMPPCDAFADDLMVATAVDRVQSALDIEVRRVAHSWAGLRTFAPDRDPLVGFDPDVKSFFWYCGQGGYGIQTAPALSALGAALARREAVPEAITKQKITQTSISPARFR